jgi:hypothetical protein
MAEEMPSIHERETYSQWATVEGTWRQPTSEERGRFYTSRVALQPAIPHTELRDRLRTAVQEAASRDAASIEALRLAVRSFTVALRDAGTTPERVLIILKTVINNKSFPVIAPHEPDWKGAQLREKISTWCIEEYFREKTA